MWVYHADSRRAILFGDWSLSNSIGFNIELYTGHGVRFYWNGSPDYNTTLNVGASTWNHIAITYDGTKLRSYLNGSLTATRDGALAARSKTAGEFRLGRDNRTTDTALNGYLNDVRIYDHCLSAAEVHEISQGLVLHYKLDGGINGNENFILASHKITSGGDASGITRTYMADDSLKVVAASGNSNWCSIGFAKNSNDNVGAKLAVGDTYTISCDVKVENGTTLPNVFINSGNSYKRLQGTIIQNQWIRAYYTSTWADPGTGYGNISLHLGFSGIAGTYYFKNFKLEKSSFPTVWSPAPADGGVNLTQIQDSSGYGHNGTITGTPALNSNTPRYSSCINLTSGQKISVTGLLTSSDPIWTANFWVKMYSNTYTAWADVITFKGNKPIRVEVSNSNGKNLAWYNYPLGTSNGIPISNINYDEWNMITMVWNGTSILSYFNGVLKYTATISGTAWTPNGEMTIGDTGMYMYMSDVRIYCTALSADDILSLYHTAAKVDNLGGLHTFEAIENLPNIIFKIDSARGAKVFQDGLSRYTQANCQVTLTDNGYRIYRPPNYNPTDNGNTMWGGLKLVNQTSDTVSPYNAARDNPWGLQKTHTYLLAFYAKGQSNNSTSFGFTNNMGWGVGGVSPNPTVLINSGIPTNFQGEKDCFCIFTINDNIIKTSNDARAGYDGSSQYLSYRHFTFGWGYTNTGTLGTDVYLTNFRLYDITNIVGKIKKNGQADFADFVEHNGIAKIEKNAEFLTNILIER